MLVWRIVLKPTHASSLERLRLRLEDAGRERRLCPDVTEDEVVVEEVGEKDETDVLCGVESVARLEIDKAGAWLPERAAAARAFSRRTEPFGSRLLPRDCTGFSLPGTSSGEGGRSLARALGDDGKYGLEGNEESRWGGGVESGEGGGSVEDLCREGGVERGGGGGGG